MKFTTSTGTLVARALVMRLAWVLAVTGCAASTDLDPRDEAMRELHEEALPHYEQGQAGTFQGAAGATIAYKAFTHGAPQAIVLAPGRCQGSHTFMQLLYELRDEPYDIYVIDHRGQGASTRMLADPLKGYVDKFDNYVADYAQLVRDVVQPARYQKVFAVAHSMGGPITLRYTLDHPDTFSGIVLSSPMLQINSGPISETDLLAYATAVDPEATIPLGDDWTHQPMFEQNYLTNDPLEFELMFEPDYIYPERRVGRATYGWVGEAIKADQARRARAAEIAPSVLLLQAGSDGVVVPAAQTAFCSAAQHCELVDYEVARHELFFAETPIRSDVIRRLLGALR